MSTILHQISRSDMNRRTQSNDRRQQTDRRRDSGRREADLLYPEQSVQLDRNTNSQAEEHFGNKLRSQGTPLKNSPVMYALSKDEIRFLLDDY